MDVVVVGRDLSPSGERFGELFDAPTVPEEIRLLGRRGVGFEGDLREHTVARDLMESVLAEFGRVDVLVNNAGNAQSPIERSTAAAMDEDDVELMLSDNLMSTIAVSQQVVPAMIGAGAGASSTSLRVLRSILARSGGDWPPTESRRPA